MGSFISALCYWYHFATTGKRITVNTAPKENMATAFLKMLRDDGTEPDPLHVRVIDCAFILYAEHDFNASTFTGRVSASTLSDTYSCVAGAIGALRGPLHGGANEAVMHMLEGTKSVEEAEKKIRDKLAAKELVMGFGHRIYKNGYPRNAVFESLSKQLSERPGGDPLLWKASDSIEAMMEKDLKMYPNADFFAASAYYQVGVPIPFFTPLFVMSRTAGWCAHIKEQLGGNGNNKIIRPSSVYNGPAKKDFVPLAGRSRL
jgi:2-methylcitrate synthase